MTSRERIERIAAVPPPETDTLELDPKHKRIMARLVRDLHIAEREFAAAQEDVAEQARLIAKHYDIDTPEWRFAVDALCFVRTPTPRV